MAVRHPAGGALVALLLYTLATLSLSQPTSAALPSRAAITNVSPRYGSLEGGTYVTITGVGFARQGVQGTTIVYVGNTVCKQIEYYTTDTQIVCVTAPHPSATVSVEVQLISVDNAHYADCRTSCSFRFHWNQTPYLRELSRSLVPGGDLMMEGYLRGNTYGEHEVRIGNTLCTFAEDDDDELVSRPWHSSRSTCTLANEIEGGRYNVTISVQAQDSVVSYGYQQNDDALWTTPIDGGKPYVVTVHPEVAQISHSSVGLLGGYPIAITGKGFDGVRCNNNKVFVAGVECVVQSCAQDSLTCELQPFEDTPEQHYAPAGIFLQAWLRYVPWYFDPVSLGSPDVAITQMAALQGFVQKFSRYGSEAIAYFVPPISGNYTFFVRSDDQSLLEMSSDEQPENMREVVHVSSYSSHFYVREGQISEPVPLEAGKRYYTRVRHRDSGGGDFFYVACSIRSAEPRNLTHLQKLHDSLRERQQVRFSTIVTREEQTITVTGATGGSFYLYGDSTLSRQVYWSSSTGHIAGAVADISWCNSISVWVHDSADNSSNAVRTYRIRYNCPTEVDFPLPSVIETSQASLTGKNASFGIAYERTASASEPVRGSFRIGYRGVWTDWMSWDASSGHVVNQLTQYTELEELHVQQSHNIHDGRRLYFTFYRPTGNVGLLTVDDSRLEGTNVSMSVLVEEEGAHDLMLDPIPAEHFQRVYTDTSTTVRVFVNDVPAGCAGVGLSDSPCAFSYNDSLTPAISHVQAASTVLDGDTIRIWGANFQDDPTAALAPLGDNSTSNATAPAIRVTLGEGGLGTDCNVTFWNASLIECMAAHSVAGEHLVDVVVEGRGRARHSNASISTIIYGRRIDTVTPVTSGAAGGRLVTITGTGFSAVGNDVVLFGQRQAEVITSAHDRIVAVVPRLSSDNLTLTAADAEAVTGPGATITVNITVNGERVPGDSTFTYDWNVTSLVTHVYPQQVPSALSSYVVFDGSFPAPADLVSNNSLCSPVMGTAPVTVLLGGGRPCEQVIVADDGSHLSCLVVRNDPLPLHQQQDQVPELRFCTAGGIVLARPEPSVRVDVAHRVSHITPRVVGLAGGAVVDIHGEGFGNVLSAVGVLIKDTNSSASVACRVFNVTNTLVQCTLDATAQPVTSAVLELQINGFVARCANATAASGTSTCSFSILRTVTPVVTGSFGTTGGAGSVLHLQGERFQLTAQQLGSSAFTTGANVTAPPLVTVGGRTCALVSFNTTHISCTVPELTAGTHAIDVEVQPVGAASAELTQNSTDSAHLHELQFVYPLRVTRMSTLTGSTAGGTRVTLHGDGFNPHHPAETNWVLLESARAVVLEATHSAIAFITPTLASDDVSSPVEAPLTIVVEARTGDHGHTHAHADTTPEIDPATNVRAAADCNTTQECTFTYDPARSGQLITVTPSQGFADNSEGVTTLTLAGTGLLGGFDPAVQVNASFPSISVTLGGVDCVVNKTSATDTQLVCALAGAVPAGSHRVLVDVAPHGIVRGAKMFTSLMRLDEVGPPLVSFGGSTRVTLQGRGFATEAQRGAVRVCGRSCHVLSSNYTTTMCSAPAISTPDSHATFNNVEPEVLRGSPSGTVAAYAAFDDDFFTNSWASASERSSCSLLFDLGEHSLASLHRIRYFPQLKARGRAIGGTFHVSRDSVNYTLVGTISAETSDGWTAIDIDPPTQYIRYIRYDGPHDGYCAMAELEYIGLQVGTLGEDNSCPVSVGVHPPQPHASLGYAARESTTSAVLLGDNGNLPSTHVDGNANQTLAYGVNATPVITAVEPKFGSSLGGTLVTLTGKRLPTANQVNGTTVAVNGYPCLLRSASADGTWVTCETTKRDALNPLSLELTTPQGHGAVSDPDVRFRYLDRWSQVNTWLNDEPPVEGDTVVIPPDQVVLMDVSPPRLFLLLVQGELVFDRQDGLELHATYIWVEGGKFEVGTEEEPFLNTATITLYGDRFTSEGLPHLGAKMLAATNYEPGSAHHHQGVGHHVPWRNRGVLDLHGRPRIRTWTKVAATVNAGDTRIPLSEKVDFEDGEEIIFTHHENMHATEELVVAGLEDHGYTIVLREPVRHTHMSGIYEVAGERIDMRVEVGIISRNIVLQGEPGRSETQQFGSHMMGAHGAMVRVENIEIRRCGQAGVLGRYCSHFHMAGDIRSSYIRSNSIHHSFQRAVTVHATYRALVRNNVAYHVRGHTYFVEDGNEKFNVIEANLGVFTQKLFVMLKSDTKPATFWMSSPANLWRDNVAAGCDNDGYWFELPSHPGGPSFTTSICPVHWHVMEFRNNTAHANGVHGLRIYPVYLPRVDPCDASSAPAPQYFYNFTSFYNGANGIFGKRNGDLHHVNAKLVGNRQEELHWKKFEGIVYRENTPNIVDSLFVNTVLGTPRAKGLPALMMPQNEFFHVAGATFVDYLDGGAIAGCASCDSDTEFKQGGYTFRLEGLRFVNSPRYVKWTAPRKQIFHDLDGSLTGFVNGTATPYYAWNHYPGLCDHMNQTYDHGIVCNNSVRVRRLQVDGISPDELDFASIQFSQLAAPNTSVGTLRFRPKEFYGYAVPIVNQHAYFASLVSLIDFRTMRIRYSEPEYLQGMEEWLELMWSYTDYRWAFDVTYANGEERPAASLITDLSVTDAFGTGKIDHNRRLWHVALTTSGIDNTVFGSVGSGGPYVLTADAIQCAPGACNDLFSTEPLYDPTHWSDLSMWCRLPDQQKASYGRFGDGSAPCEGVTAYPQPGDSVVINSRMYVVLDMDPPRMSHLQIIGKLEFADDADRTLEADNIEVWGTLQVGSPGRPFSHQAVIRLHGQRVSPTLIVHNSRFLGNKVLAVLGDLQLHGQRPTASWERLETTAEAGSSKLIMHGAVDWSAGDRLVITATEYDASTYETVEVAAVSSDGMNVTLTSPLQHRHFAGAVDSGRGEVDLRAAVGKLNRNVRFEGASGSGEGGDTYGAHIVVMDVRFDEGLRVGSSSVTGVELHHCGQRALEHACILYVYGQTYPENDQPINQLHWSSMSDGNNYGIVSEGSHGISVQNNVIHRTFRDGIELDADTARAVIRHNLLVGNHRSPDEAVDWVRPHAFVFADTASATLQGNVVSGGEDAGFVVRADTCTATGDQMRIVDNEAHGVLVGAFVVAESRGCLALHRFKAWKAAHIGIVTVDQRSAFRLREVVVADSHIGISANFFNPALHTQMWLVSSIVMGTTAASTCDASLRCRAMVKGDVAATSSSCNSVFGNGYRRVGLLIPQVTNRGKTCGQDNLPVCRPVTTPERLCSMSWEKRYGLPGTQHTELHVVDTGFSHFNSSDCGLQSVGISLNPTQRNYAPEQFYEGITWHSTAPTARFYFDVTGISQHECRTGCDAMQQLLAHDRDGTLSGTGTPGVVTSAANPGLVDNHSRCTTLAEQGAFHCTNMPLRALTFENIDRDRGGRRIGPIKMERMYNETVVERRHFSLGPFDDGCAKRFFFGQYPMLLETGRMYRVNISNTMPNNARIRLHSSDPSDKVLLLIYYYNDNLALRVVQNGRQVEPLQRLPTLADSRASNAYPGGNTFYLVLQGSASAPEQIYDLRTVNKVQLNLTLSVSLSDFYSNRDKLVDNLAILLDIPSHRIKVVQVHEVNLDDARQQALAKRRQESSRRRRAEDGEFGVDVEMEILDANNSTVPTTDEESEEQLEELNAVVGTFAEVASTGALKTTLESAGIPLEAVAVAPPAGNGVNAQASFSVAITTTTTSTPAPTMDGASTVAPATTSEVDAGNSSSGWKKAVGLGTGISAACLVVIAVAAVIVTRQKRANARARSPVMKLDVEKSGHGAAGAAGVGDALRSMEHQEGPFFTTKMASTAEASVHASRPNMTATQSEAIEVENVNVGSAAAALADADNDTTDNEGAPSQQRQRRPSLLSRLAQSAKRGSGGSKDDLVSPGVKRVRSRRGLNPLRNDQMGNSVETDGLDEVKLKTWKRMPGPSINERVEAFHRARCRVVSRLTWEYVSMHDWYHPTIGSETAQRIVREKPIGTFLVYGRLHCFLCVRAASSVVRHDAIEHSKSSGYRLHIVEEAQPWFPDLSSLVEYYRQPRPGLPYVLLSEANNDIHFTLPNPTSRVTTTEQQHLQTPEYTNEDLNRLSRRISKRVRKRSSQLSNEHVRLDPATVPAKRGSVRTQEAIDSFKPLLLNDSIEEKAETTELPEQATSNSDEGWNPDTFANDAL